MLFLMAFLEKPVFIHQPEGFADPAKPHHVCLLKKALYGLKQAPRAWYDSLKAFLITCGFQPSVFDSSLFFLRHSGKLLLVLIYVDDILITGEDPLYISQLISAPGNKFAFKTLGEVGYFLGL